MPSLDILRAQPLRKVILSRWEESKSWKKEVLAPRESVKTRFNQNLLLLHKTLLGGVFRKVRLKIQIPSIFYLVLMGFIAVLLPTLTIVFYGAQSLDQIAKNHRKNTEDLVLITKKCNSLEKDLEGLWRLGRQIQLVDDDDLRRLLKDKYTWFMVELQRILSYLPEAKRQTPSLTKLKKRLTRIFELADTTNPKVKISTDKFNDFESIILLFNDLKQDLGHVLSSKLEKTKKFANDLRSKLILLGGGLLIVTLVLIGCFTLLITKPIRQLDTTIRKLGDGIYSERIDLKGPMDLQNLAIRLNWLRERLINAETTKKKFLHHITHELKTPLATIKEGACLLADNIPGPLTVSQKEVVSILKGATHDLQNLISNLLDYNLVKSNHILNISTISINNLVEEIRKAHLFTIERKELSFLTSGKALNIAADYSLLRAAIDNVISNAIHYSRPNGIVKVCWMRSKRGLTIKISDNGPGIAKNERAHVFQPFFQGSNVKNGPLKGTGLGLALAKESIELHQGSIKILDEAKGCTFAISIPVTP